MKIVRNLTAMAAVAGALTIAGQARADVIDFYLNQPECTDGCGAGTAPALLSNANSVEVIVTTTAGSAGDYTGATVELVAPDSTTIDTPIWLNINGIADSSPSYSNLSVSITHTGGTDPAVDETTGSEDHFGTFNLGTGSQSGNTTVTFNLTATGTLFWTDASTVLKPTTGFGAAYSQGFDVVTAAQNAGFYAATPLPAALPLFATGLGAMGLLGWRRKRKAQALAA
jgi:hypothetical protein